MAELEKSEQEILLENGSIRKNVWNYGIPCALITLINTFYNIVDQIFIGNGVGYLGNGATNVIFPLTTIALACGLLAGSGCAANFSILLGAGERKKAAKCMGNAISLLFTEGILFAVISLLLLPKIVIWFGATDKVYPYAMGYGRIICFGFSFYMISIGLSHILRVDGRPQIATMSTVIGCVINCILDPLFIFKFKWGVEGAAFATIIGQFASLIFSTIAILRTKTVCLSKKDFILDFCLCRKIICGGVTEFCLNICVTILFVVNNNLLVKYGAKSIYGAEIPLATYGIMMKLGHILSALTTGMSQGAQPLIGYCYGKGDYQRVKKAILFTLAQGFMLGVIVWGFCMIFTREVLTLFGAENNLYMEFGIKLIHIYLGLVCLNSIQITVSNIMTSLGKGYLGALLTVGRNLILCTFSGLILCSMVGVNGVMYEGPIADGGSTIFALVMIWVVWKKLNINK